MPEKTESALLHEGRGGEGMAVRCCRPWALPAKGICWPHHDQGGAESRALLAMKATVFLRSVHVLEGNARVCSEANLGRAADLRPGLLTYAQGG